MIENSQYVSLQNYTNESNIVITNKNRPQINKVCKIDLTSSYVIKEAPMRYLKVKSKLPKYISKKDNNYYNRDHSEKHNIYTNYVINASITPKEGMVKRYNEIAEYNRICNEIEQQNTIEKLINSSCINMIINTMKRFNYIMDNSCNIINSGYGKNIFESKYERKAKSKLGKLLYDLAEYYYCDEQADNVTDVTEWMDLSTMKFDVSKLSIDNICIGKIKQHYQKKIENKTLYWVPIIRTIQKPKRPTRIYEKMSNRQSYRFKRIKYKDKFVNADVFDAFNKKQFYFPLRTYIKQIKTYKENGNVDTVIYEDPSATIKNMIYDPSIHSINPLNDVKKDTPFDVSLDILEMIYGKSVPLLNITTDNISDKLRYTYENNFSFYPIYDTIDGNVKILNNTGGFFERCINEITNRRLLRFRTYDSSTNIVIPSNKFGNLTNHVKKCSKLQYRSMYKLKFELGIAIIDKSGRQYKTSNKPERISMNVINNNTYMIPKYVNTDISTYFYTINDSNLPSGFNFVKAKSASESIIGEDTGLYAWGELNEKEEYTQDTYGGVHAKNNQLEMAYDKFASKTNGLAMIPTAQQMQEFIRAYDKGNGFPINVANIGGNKYKVYIGNSSDNILFYFESNSSVSIKFWTRTLQSSNLAYVIVFNMSKSAVAHKSFEIKNIYINTQPVYSSARILPIIQNNTCILSDVSISGSDKVTGVTLDKRTLNLKTFQSKKLSAIIAPDDALNKEIVWSSSDESKATVNKVGTVKAISRKSSTVTITANSSADMSKQDSCKVNITSYADAFKTNYVKMDNSSIYWSKYNLGVDPDKVSSVNATAEDWLGYKFAWGEVTPKNKYTSDTYHPIYDNHDILKYDEPEYEYVRDIFFHTPDDEIDDPAGYMLQSDPSVSSMKYNAWRVPKISEFQSLIDNSEIKFEHSINYGTEFHPIFLTSLKLTSKITNNSISIPMNIIEDQFIDQFIDQLISGKYWTNQKENCYEFKHEFLKTAKDSFNKSKYTDTGQLSSENAYKGLYIRPVMEEGIPVNKYLPDSTGREGIDDMEIMNI